MRELLATGLSAAEAARQAWLEPPAARRTSRAGVPRRPSSRRRSSGSTTPPRTPRSTGCSPTTHAAVLDGVVLPLLRELGDGWERGEISVAQEHFASNLLRGRLLGLARGWDRGPARAPSSPVRRASGTTSASSSSGSHCASTGWRITFLGADTPARDDRRDRASGSSRRRSCSPSPIRRGCEGVAETAARLARRRHHRLGRRRGSASPSRARSCSAGSPLEAAAQVVAR